MPDVTAKQKLDIIFSTADMACLKGLDIGQRTRLGSLRKKLTEATINQADIETHKRALANFYAGLPEIRTESRTVTTEEILEMDEKRIARAITAYDPVAAQLGVDKGILNP